LEDSHYSLAARRTVIQAGVSALRITQKIGLGSVARQIINHFERSGVSPSKVEALRLRVFSQDRGPLNAERPAIMLKVSDPYGVEKSNFRARLSEIATPKPVHVFLEAGAQIPEFLGNKNLPGTPLTIYSFADTSDQILELKIGHRTTAAPLRDQFNEISNEGYSLFDFGQKIARRLLDELEVSMCPELAGFSERLKESISTALDGRINSRLSLALCYREALRRVPANETVLFVAQSPHYFAEGWDVFSDSIDDSRTFVAFTHSDRARLNEFGNSMAETLQRLAGTPSPEKEEFSEFPTELAGVFNPLIEQVRVNAEGAAKSIEDRLMETEYNLVVHGETATAYKETLGLVGRALIDNYREGLGALPVFLHAAWEPERSVMPGLLDYGRDTDVASMNLKRIGPPIDKNVIPAANCGAIAARFGETLHEEFLFDGINTFPILESVISRFIRVQFGSVVAAHAFGESLGRRAPPSAVVASPTRHWLTRSICAGILDGSADTVPVLDVQSLNILQHPKYRTPVATHCSVIDTAARDIYTRHFHFPTDRVHLVGAPQNDHIKLEAEQVDQAKLTHNLGIPPESKIIVLISQLQPMARMAKLVAPVADILKNDPELRLIIRLHPRETSDRRAAYTRMLAACGALDKTIFSQAENAISILCLADVCLTIYSNMAREAALMGKPVIVTRFQDWEPPIRLDEEGIAVGAASAGEVTELIRATLNPATRSEVLKRQFYFQQNSHLLRGDASKSIAALTNTLSEDFGLHGRTRQLANANTHTAGADQSRQTLVVTRDLGLAELPPLFRPFSKLTVYSMDGSNDRGFIPGTAAINRGGFKTDTAADFEAAVKDSDALTMRVIELIGEELRELPETEKLYDILRRSFWLRARARIIREMQGVALSLRGIKNSVDGKLVIACGNVEMRNYLCNEAIERRGGTAGITVLHRLADSSWSAEPVDVYLRNIVVAPRAALAPPRPRGKVLQANGDLEAWAGGVGRHFQSETLGPRILATTSWHLKTVPPTLLPVLSHHLSQGFHVAAMDISEPNIPLLKSNLKSLPNGADNSTVVELSNLVAGAFPPPPRAMKILVNQATRRLAEEPEFSCQAPVIKEAINSTVNHLLRTWLPEAIIWFRYCDEWFKGGGGVSLACPGRQWHADIAHIAAERHGALSITLQNAYMTEGYTYTAPTGEYITAIDQWSKNVFVQHYGVNPDSVHVISTPRFDYLKDLAKLDQNLARRSLELSPDEIILLFATQVGFEDDAQTITRALAGVTHVDGRVVRHIVKLHPRTATSELRLLNEVASQENRNHTVTVVADDKIQDYLAASDIVLTMFSNVGTEAAVLGRKLIIAKFSDDPLPVPMDEFGFAYVAKSPSDLQEAISRFITDEKFIHDQAKNQRTYRAANRSMVAGDSVKQLSRAIEEATRRLPSALLGAAR
jgi:CDP-glycerol glycerophosphotransferase (TagB/SpsB family)